MSQRQVPTSEKNIKNCKRIAHEIKKFSLFFVHTSYSDKSFQTGCARVSSLHCKIFLSKIILIRYNLMGEIQLKFCLITLYSLTFFTCFVKQLMIIFIYVYSIVIITEKKEVVDIDNIIELLSSTCNECVVM